MKSSSNSKIKVGRSLVNRSGLDGLRWAWKDKQLVLFLGAGVSIPYGVPSWKNLVLELLFEQAGHTKRLGHMWPHYRRALASWMTDYFEYNPLVLARMVERYYKKRSSKKGVTNSDKDHQIFLNQLRTQLYVNCRTPAGTRTSLQAIADLVEKSRGNVRCVVTFNFDALLEEELEKRKIHSIPIVNGDRQLSGGFRVIHPHGFVPRAGVIDRGPLVFTEDDYHRLTDTVFHWGLSEIVNELRHSTALFIGLSMSDPSLRRLLDATRNSKIPPHWQLQQKHRVRDQEHADAKTEIEKRALKWGKVLGYDEQKKEEQLSAALNQALEQADSYDRALFQTMGVKTIWLDSFDDIPTLLDEIPKTSKKKKQK